MQFHNSLGKPGSLEIVVFDDLSPVLSYLRKVETLTDIDQVQNIFLEARSSKANTGLQELWPYSCVSANSFCYFGHISPCCFTDRRFFGQGRYWQPVWRVRLTMYSWSWSSLLESSADSLPSELLWLVVLTHFILHQL